MISEKKEVQVEDEELTKVPEVQVLDPPLQVLRRSERKPYFTYKYIKFVIDRKDLFSLQSEIAANETDKKIDDNMTKLNKDKVTEAKQWRRS